MLRWIIVGLVAGLCGLPALSSARASQDDKVKKLIVQLLQDKDVKKRRLALIALEVEGARVKGVVQAMTIALEKDEDPVVRREVALALGRMGEDGKEAVPALAYALTKDKDDQTREVAARALLQMVPHSKRALEQLVAALQDSYPPTRAAAAETIKMLGELSKSAVPQLMDYLKSPKDKKTDASARMHITLALGRIGPEAAKAAVVLATVIADAAEDVTTREAAADSLARFGLDGQPAAKEVAAVLQNTKNELVLRLAAVKALAKIEGDTKVVWPALKIGLEDGDSSLRLQTIRAAGQYGREEPEVIKILAKLARGDDNVEVRLAAIQELGIIGAAARDAEKDLRFIVANDEREAVRQYADAALKKILGQ
jgi:HEAT repeat protein